MMRAALISIAIALAGCAAYAQEPPAPQRADLRIEAPKPKPSHATRNLLVADTLLFASTYFEATGAAHGSGECRRENLRAHGNLQYFSNLGGGLYHPYRHDLKITLQIDAGVSLVSFWLHKKHHDTLALLFPIAGASAQFSTGVLKYVAGCF